METLTLDGAKLAIEVTELVDGQAIQRDKFIKKQPSQTWQDRLSVAVVWDDASVIDEWQRLITAKDGKYESLQGGPYPGGYCVVIFTDEPDLSPEKLLSVLRGATFLSENINRCFLLIGYQPFQQHLTYIDMALTRPIGKQFLTPSAHPKLSHKTTKYSAPIKTMIQIEIFNETDDSSEAICRDYWKLTDEGEFTYRVSEVSEVHAIPQSKLNKLLRASCQVQDDAIKCNGCGEPHIVSTRSEWLSLRRQPRRGQASRLCSDCETKRDQERAAEEARLRKERYDAWLAEYTRVANLIEEQYGSPPITQIDVRDLPFRAAIYLLAVFNFYASDDFMVLSPRDETLSGKLAPTEELGNEMWSYLIEQELIGIHTGSSPDAFTEGQDEKLIPHLSLVSWRPLFAESSDDAASTVEDLRALILSKTWPSQWIAESQMLAREIALHECLNIIDKLMSERGLKPTLGRKTRSNLNLMLRSCSIGEAACIISQCVKGASDYMVKDRVSRFQAANTVPNQLLRRFQRLSDKYDNLYSFNRTADNPESEVSHVLFNLALQAGPDWFATPLVKFERAAEAAAL